VHKGRKKATKQTKTTNAEVWAVRETGWVLNAWVLKNNYVYFVSDKINSAKHGKGFELGTTNAG